MSDFSNYKTYFFQKHSSISKIDQIEEAPVDITYRFMADNYESIELEREQLEYIIDNNLIPNKKVYQKFYDECCDLLLSYYKKNAYDKPDKVALYEKIKAKRAGQKMREDSFNIKLKKDFIKLLNVPTSIVEMRGWVGYFNLRRILLVFSRLSVRELLVLLMNTGVVDTIDHILNQKTDINKMVDRMNSLTGIFNIGSISFFAARFFMHSAMIIMHTCMPNEEESDKKKGLSAWERFIRELRKRHCDMANDVAWFSINGLTNFSNIFHLSAPLANGLISGFLVFDALLLSYRYYIAREKYLEKRAEYLDARKNGADASLLKEQIRILDIHWLGKTFEFIFNIVAAATLWGGFTASALLTGPLVAPLCFLLCTFGVTMYLSAENLGNWMKDEEMLTHFSSKSDATLRQKGIQQRDQSRQTFFVSATKSFVAPICFFGVFAVSWQAAIVLAVVYLGCEYIYNTYQKHSESPIEPGLDPVVDSASSLLGP